MLAYKGLQLLTFGRSMHHEQQDIYNQAGELEGSIAYDLHPSFAALAYGKNPLITGTITFKDKHRKTLGTLTLDSEGMVPKPTGAPALPRIMSEMPDGAYDGQPMMLKGLQLANFQTALFDALSHEAFDGTLMDRVASATTAIAQRFLARDTLTKRYANERHDSYRPADQKVLIYKPGNNKISYGYLVIHRDTPMQQGKVPFEGSVDIYQYTQPDPKKPVKEKPLVRLSITPEAVTMQVLDAGFVYGSEPFTLHLEEGRPPLMDNAALGPIMRHLSQLLITNDHAKLHRHAELFFNDLAKYQQIYEKPGKGVLEK